MPTVWRIVKKRHAGSAFDGEGARRFGGRWNSPGTAVVYASETRALSLLEVLAGLGSVGPVPSYVLISATFEETMVLGVEADALPPEWRRYPPHPGTQRMGDEWVDRGRSAVLRVPSSIVPDEFNYLLNPGHPAFPGVRIGEPNDLGIDRRLLGR